MLPLIYIYNMADILFFYKIHQINLTSQTILTLLQDLLAQSYTPRQPIQTLSHLNSYFYHLPRLWNYLPIIDLSLSDELIKSKL